MVFGLSLAYILDRRLVTASVFALVPDFDITMEYIYPFVHRGIMHSLLAAFTFSLLVYLYSRDRISAESCFLGYTSALALDSLTSSGVPFLFPFGRTYSLDLLSAYSPEGNIAIITASLAGMWLKKNLDLGNSGKVQIRSIKLKKG